MNRRDAVLDVVSGYGPLTEERLVYEYESGVGRSGYPPAEPHEIQEALRQLHEQGVVVERVGGWDVKMERASWSLEEMRADIRRRQEKKDDDGQTGLF